jgi:hypothetical protein
MCLAAEEENVRKLLRIRDHSENDSCRLTAIGMLLDRSRGKPVQSVQGGGKDGSFVLQVITGVAGACQRSRARAAV